MNRVGLRSAVCGIATVLVATTLAACGSSGGGSSGGRVTLNFYNFPDNSGAIQQAADTCSKQSGGKYVIKYNKLPTGADGQRQQMVRRLAARDSAMDILGLDVTWAPEFAEAGWIREWTGDNKARSRTARLQTSAARRRRGRTSSTPSRSTATPSCSGTATTWCRSRPRPGTR